MAWFTAFAYRGGSASDGVVSTSTALVVQQTGLKFCWTSGDPNNA